MIELFRTANNAASQEIEAALKELVVAHKIITVESLHTASPLPPGTPLPALKDKDQIITGAEIPVYLKDLAKFVADWRRFQSDSCYVEDDGTSC